MRRGDRGHEDAVVDGARPRVAFWSMAEAPGGTARTGIGFIQVSTHKQAYINAPPLPPETFGAFSKKSEENSDVEDIIGRAGNDRGHF